MSKKVISTHKLYPLQDVTEPQAKEIIKVVQQGLCKGIGSGKPGDMCIEAAVCYVTEDAKGYLTNDSPLCVNNFLSSLKITINDLYKGTRKNRAKLLIRLGLLQLGTSDIPDFIIKFINLIKTHKLIAGNKWLQNKLVIYASAYYVGNFIDVMMTEEISLSQIVQIIEDTLIQMKVPGVKWLKLLKKI